MAVYDRWHRKGRPGEQPCKCSRGRTPLFPSASHQQGDRWQVRWYDDTGKQKKRSFPLKEGKNPGQHADAFDAMIKRDLDTGDYTDPSAALVTFREYAEQWRATRARDVSGAELLEARFRLHVYPKLGDKPLRLLAKQPTITAGWVRWLEGRMADSTARQVITDVSGVFIAAMNDGLIAVNPTRSSSVVRPVPVPRKPRAWPAERVQAMAAALPQRYRVIPLLGAGTGMRQGELFGLALEDIAFLGRSPHIRVLRQVKLVGNRPHFALPKRYKTREVPLAPEVAEALAEHLRLFPPALVTLPWHEPRNRQRHGKLVTARLVLTGARGRAVDRDNFNRGAWHPAQEACGITPRLRPGEKRAPAHAEGMHALRHTFASAQLGAGTSVTDVAAWMGDTPAVVLATYAHFLPGNEGRGRAAISAFFTGASDQNVPSEGKGRALCLVNKRRRHKRWYSGEVLALGSRLFWPAKTPVMVCRRLSRSAGAHVPAVCPARCGGRRERAARARLLERGAAAFARQPDPRSRPVRRRPRRSPDGLPWRQRPGRAKLRLRHRGGARCVTMTRSASSPAIRSRTTLTRSRGAPAPGAGWQ